jgi:hypothetical protein
MAYNFQTGNNRVTLLTECDHIAEKVIFGKLCTRLIDVWERI